MEEEEYYEEEVVEEEQDDDSSMGDEELLESITANLRALQMERKQQQQQQKQEKPAIRSNDNDDGDDGEEEEIEEEVEQEQVIEEEIVSLQGSANPSAVDDPQGGSFQEALLESQATFESVYTDTTDSPRRRISRCSSTVIEEIPIGSQDEDDEYEEQVIEQWFRRDEIPDDLETACRALIPIVYRGEDAANDPDRMIRRTPLKELYLYLRQHYTFQKEVQKKELEELPKESVHQQKQTSLEDLMGQRQRQQELQQQTQQQEQQAKLKADSFDDSETIMEVIVDDSSTIVIEEDMESLCSPTRWMSPRSKRLGVEVRTALENATLLEESQYTEVLVDEDDSGVSQVEEETVYEEILSPVSRKSVG